MLRLVGFLRNPIIAGAFGLLIGLPVGFLRGHEAGSDNARVAQLEAELAAEREAKRREAALAKRLEREKSDLETALEQIDAQTRVDTTGDACPLDADYRLRLSESYD
jgi:hypothetical protein